MAGDTSTDFPWPEATGDKYELGDELGHGGVGRVHQARDLVLGRDVAVKFLHERFHDDPGIRDRFVEEAQIGGQLEHPGVVPVYDLGRVGNELFFAMKLIEGETLAQQLAQRSDPGDRRRHFLSVFEGVCQTIAFAHARSVVHRDLKPDNVMIGAFGEVQVVDWGFGKLLAGDESVTETTAPTASETSVGEPTSGSSGSGRLRTVRSESSGTHSVVGSAIGTPAYMPPEQAVGDVAAICEGSDVFSLGAVLCEILTGQPPYSESGGVVLLQAARGQLEPARARLDGCGADPALIELAKDCLQVEIADRPRDARVVAERIRAHLSEAEARAHEASLAAARAEVQVRAMKRTRLLGALLLLVFAGGLITSLRYASAAEAAAEEERAAKQARERELERSVEFRRLVTAMLDGVTPEYARAADTTLLEGILEEAASHLASGELTDPGIAGELHYLVGRVYMSLASYPDALVHLQKAVELREVALGASDPQTIGTMLALSEVLSKSGQSDAGDALRERVITRFEATFGPRDSNTLVAKLHRGLAHVYAENLEAAEQSLDELREPVTEVLGKGSSSYAMMQSAFAQIYAKTERLDRGFQCGSEALRLLRARHGDDHPDVLFARANLAQISLSLGEVGVAIEQFERCRELDEQVFGEDDPRTLRGLCMLTRAYEEDGQMERALGLADLVLERCGEREGVDELRCDALHDRMLILRRSNRFEEAIRSGRELFRLRTEHFGAEYDETLGAGTDLAGTLLLAGEVQAGIDILEDVYPLDLETLGPAHPFTRTAFEALTEAYMELGRRSDAMRLVQDLRQRLLDDPDAPAELLINGVHGLLAEPDTEAAALQQIVGYATRAVALAESGDRSLLVPALEALAQAELRAGDTAAAGAALERALATLPEAAPGRDALRAALEDARRAANGR